MPYRALVLAVLCSAAGAHATTVLAASPWEVRPGARAKNVPLNAEVRVFGRLATTPDARWALFSADGAEVPCDARVTASAHHRLIELHPRALLQADADYAVFLGAKEVSRFRTGTEQDVAPPTPPVLTGAALHTRSLFELSGDWWELLGTPSKDDQPGVEYFVSLAPAGAALSDEPDLLLRGGHSGLPSLECPSCARHGAAVIDPKNFEVRVVAIDLAGHRSAPVDFSVREPRSRAWVVLALVALGAALGLVGLLWRVGRAQR